MYRLIALFTIFQCYVSAVGQNTPVDSNAMVIIERVDYVGNKKTKELILNRELTFEPGDTVSMKELNALLVRSNENIFNTSLFNKVEHEVTFTNNQQVVITYTLEERWYIWPYPILENADRNFNTWWQTKDFNRLNYGVNLTAYNFRGRNETLSILAKVGFEDQLSVGYAIPNLNKKRTLGISVAGGYAEYREVNYASVNNKRVFYRSETGTARTTAFARAALTYRKSLNSRHQIRVNYTHDRVDGAVLNEATDFFSGGDSLQQYMSLHYYGKYDTRDYIHYPLKGYKVELYLNQMGLGLFDNHNLNLTTAIAGFNWHKPLAEKWFVGSSVVGKATLGDPPPYSLQQGLGYAYIVRGYELFVMDAQNYGLVRNNLKYRLMKKRTFPINWLKVDKFNKPYFTIYANLHADFGYAHDTLYAQQNSLSNKWLLGYGAGIDMVAYYDLVMRLEYTFNIEGQHGFYLHFKKSI